MTDAVRGLDDLDVTAKQRACDKLMELWDWRAKDPDHPPASKELSAFCWWFIKDTFEEGWALGCLANALEGGAELELDGHVLKKLRSLASSHTWNVLRCVEAIAVDERNRSWGIYLDEVEGILRSSLNSTKAADREKARELIHTIGSQGFFSLRELLTE